MQFFLTVPHDSAEEPTMASMDPAELEAALAAVEKFNTDLHESGAFRFAGGLHPRSTAKTVDATNDEPVVVDGPFVEAPEYVGGFWVIEAADQEAAVRWATQASKALGGASRCAPFRTRRTPDRTQIADSPVRRRGVLRARPPRPALSQADYYRSSTEPAAPGLRHQPREAHGLTCTRSPTAGRDS